jgi:hypothetical protein
MKENMELLFNGYRVSVFYKMKRYGDGTHSIMNAFNITDL